MLNCHRPTTCRRSPRPTWPSPSARSPSSNERRRAPDGGPAPHRDRVRTRSSPATRPGAGRRPPDLDAPPATGRPRRTTDPAACACCGESGFADVTRYPRRHGGPRPSLARPGRVHPRKQRNVGQNRRKLSEAVPGSPTRTSPRSSVACVARRRDPPTDRPRLEISARRFTCARHLDEPTWPGRPEAEIRRGPVDHRGAEEDPGAHLPVVPAGTSFDDGAGGGPRRVRRTDPDGSGSSNPPT